MGNFIFCAESIPKNTYIGLSWSIMTEVYKSSKNSDNNLRGGFHIKNRIM